MIGARKVSVIDALLVGVEIARQSRRLREWLGKLKRNGRAIRQLEPGLIMSPLRIYTRT